MEVEDLAKTITRNFLEHWLKRSGEEDLMESTPHQTYILDPYSPAELAQLINQDRMLTQTK